MLRRDHSIGLRKARTAANRIARDLEERFNCECVWQANTLLISRAGVTGTMTVAKDSIDLHLKLGFLLAAFRPKIEESISANFRKYFG